MSEHFVCVKVDREERPDIDAIYMEAVQGMTGQGGWPLTVFCDPEGVPFYGGTYFPPEPRHGMPSFPMVMEAIVQSWTTQRDQIRESAARIREQLAAVGRVEPAQEPADPGLLDAAVAALDQAADRRNGGFGGAPKFPPASALEFLLARGDTEIVELTLDRMAAGGIHDQIGGGFARYSVDDRWLVPHFEKMLYDNALLARAYLHGYQALGHERWRTVCERTLDWMLARDARGRGRLLLGPRRRLRGGRGQVLRLDAGRDPRAARRPAPSAVIEYYGVTERGNFEGANILHLPGGLEATAPPGLDEARRALYEARAKRIWPGLDDKRVLSWNALAIAALADAGAVLDRPDYLDAARSCAGSCSRRCATPTAGCCAPTTVARRNSTPTWRTTRF